MAPGIFSVSLHTVYLFAFEPLTLRCVWYKLEREDGGIGIRVISRKDVGDLGRILQRSTWRSIINLSEEVHYKFKECVCSLICETSLGNLKFHVEVRVWLS